MVVVCEFHMHLARIFTQHLKHRAHFLLALGFGLQVGLLLFPYLLQIAPSLIIRCLHLTHLILRVLEVRLLLETREGSVDDLDHGVLVQGEVSAELLVFQDGVVSLFQSFDA